MCQPQIPGAPKATTTPPTRHHDAPVKASLPWRQDAARRRHEPRRPKVAERAEPACVNLKYPAHPNDGKRIDNQLLTGFLIDNNFNVRRSEILLTKFSGAKAIHLEKSLATEAFIKKVQTLGFYCIVWSVNDPAVMERLANMGVEAIITDKPDLLKNINMSLQHA